MKRVGVHGVKTLAKIAGLGLVAGGAGVAWGMAETRAFTMRHRTISFDREMVDAENMGELPEKPLRILHLSDLHLRTGQTKKQKWVTSLASYKPDLVVLTGDLISEAKALPVLLETLKPFLALPAVYVYGSNDYCAPYFKNPFLYLLGPSSQNEKQKRGCEGLPWHDMEAAFKEAGWVNLNNTRGHCDIGQWSINFVGVDDAHISRDRYPAAPAEGVEDDGVVGKARMKIGVTHAPYARVLDAMSEEKCHVIFAGHTHGGQVCLPKVGALVTNCDLPRLYASGLFQWPPTGEEPRCADAQVSFGQRATVTALTSPDQPKAPLYEEAEALRVSREDWLPSRGVRRAWVNVSAGLGTSPFAPVRIACRPEAIVIDIVRG
ncbi:MAG: metallophosphoesterase family protein [Actinomycetaceae bacterium]|nr:metallophosphoesterase family protein [Actinomycetaceae bacterium]